MLKRQPKGLTLLEMAVAITMAALLMLVISRLVNPVGKFFQRSQARQVANMEARACMDAIQKAMSNGKVSTLNIYSPSTPPAVPFSKAKFSTVDKTLYTIYLSTEPMNSLHVQQTPSGGPMTDKTLGTHVTALHFTLDLNNPTHIYISLEIKIPMNSSGLPDSFYTLLLPTQPVSMLSS